MLNDSGFSATGWRKQIGKNSAHCWQSLERALYEPDVEVTAHLTDLYKAFSLSIHLLLTSWLNSQEMPWSWVQLHAALPARLVLVTSLSFPIPSVWIRIPLQGKIIFLCNPQFNTDMASISCCNLFPLIKLYPFLLCPFSLSRSIFLLCPASTFPVGFYFLSLSFSPGNLPAVQQKGAHRERLGKHNIITRISNILLIKHLKSTVAGWICQYGEKCQF